MARNRLRAVYEEVDPAVISEWVSEWSPAGRELAPLCARRHADIALELGISEGSSQKRVQAMADRAPTGLAVALAEFQKANAVKDLIAWAYEDFGESDEVIWSWDAEHSSEQLAAAVLERLATAHPRPDQVVLRAYSRTNPDAVLARIRGWRTDDRVFAYAAIIEGGSSSSRALDDKDLRDIEAHGAELAQSIPDAPLQVHALSALAIAGFRAGVGSWPTRIEHAERKLAELGPTLDRVHAKAAIAVAIAEMRDRNYSYELASEALTEAQGLSLSRTEAASALSAAAYAMVCSGRESTATVISRDIEQLSLNISSPRMVGSILVSALRVLAAIPNQWEDGRRIKQRIKSRPERSDAEAIIAISAIRSGRASAQGVEDLLGGARAEAGRLLPGDKARVLAAASDALQASDPVRSAELATRSFQMLTVPSELHHGLHAISAISSELAHAGRRDAASRLQDGVAHACGRLVDAEQRAHVFAALAGSSAAHDSGRALDFAKRACEIGARNSIPVHELVHLQSRVASALASGGLAEGAEHADRAREQVDAIEDQDQRLFALIAVAEAYRVAGREGTAEQLLERVMQGLGSVNEPTSSWLRLSTVHLVLEMKKTKQAARRHIDPILDPGVRATAWSEAALQFARYGDKDGFRVACGGALAASATGGHRVQAQSQVAIAHAEMGDLEVAMEMCRRLDESKAGAALSILANEVFRITGDASKTRSVLMEMVNQASGDAQLLEYLNRASRALVGALEPQDIDRVLEALLQA